MSRWLLLTAGLGSKDFEESAQRVARQASGFGIFAKIVALDTLGTVEVCSRVSRVYPDQFRAGERGFGFMAWKSELVLSALEGQFGKFDGVLWVDGGCEINVNYWSRLLLKKQLGFAEKYGVAAFTLDTPEIYFTKADLLDRFGFIGSPESLTPQFQTTWFALSGVTGFQIAQEWLTITLEDYSYSDVGLSKLPEAAEFVENRYDQSIFSVVCKKNGIRPMSYKPAAGTSGFKSEFRAAFHPIWTSRNRKGKSVIPPWVQKLQQNFGGYIEN